MKKTCIVLLTILCIFTFNLAYAAEKTNFTIKNVQNNTEKVEYTYNIHIDNVRGAVQIKNGSKEDYVVFDYEGNSSIKVLSNTDLVLMGIPKGSNYNITVAAVDGYNVKIEDLDFSTYKGIIGNNTSISVNSYSLKKEDSKVTIPTEKKKEEKKENPATSDHIALIGLAALFAILFIYMITHKSVAKYEDS